MDENRFQLQNHLDEYQIVFLKKKAREIDLRLLNQFLCDGHFEKVTYKFIPFTIILNPGIFTQKNVRGRPMDVFVTSLSANINMQVMMQYVVVGDLKQGICYKNILKSASINHLDSSSIYNFALKLAERNIIPTEALKSLHYLQDWKRTYELFMTDICQRKFEELIPKLDNL